MRKALLAVGAVFALVVLVIGTGAFASNHGHGKRLHVIEHAVTDTVTDTGASGDSPGDLLTWHNMLYDASDSQVVGSDQGDCIRIDTLSGSWECRWTNVLEGGQIMVEGPFYDARSSVIAVTGGTGRYRNARGEMKLIARNGGTEYDFIFSLIGTG